MMVSTLALGSPAPNFDLPGIDNRKYSLASFADKPILVVIFSCNHCPYVKDYETRMVSIQRDYAAKGVQLVAVNSNDAEAYPEDSFPEMVKRARERGFNFPYLRDESQKVAKAYGAERTPEVFVFDEKRTLCYHGRIDDNVYDPKEVRQHYLRDALDAVIMGRKVTLEDTEPVGCTIKWK